jgi:hypothetical protein
MEPIVISVRRLLITSTEDGFKGAGEFVEDLVGRSFTQIWMIQPLSLRNGADI